MSPAHLLPWDRGEGEERRGAGPAHLRQVLGQQDSVPIGLFHVSL